MTRLRILLALFILNVCFIGAAGQDILLTIGDNEITLDEFERIYNKNNNAITSNQQSPEEYLEMFINFKLKVLEAENMGLDTTAAFIREFNTYKDQLAKPYLADEETREAMMKEAYERMKTDVHVSHILLGMSSQPTPEDTLERYNRAMEIRQRILDGEDFGTVARATSEDPGARVNGGDLGYFTVFMMLYPFETAAYELEVGEISMPVRTMHGYHIIKKHDERPAVGQVKTAHIFLGTPENMSREEQQRARDKVMAISDSLEMGSSFEEMARRYSDDRNSAANGGELPWFGTGRMIRQFEQQAFSLKKTGDITEPFRTSYGWHIIKLLDKKGIGTYEEMESTLQSKALKGDRDRVSKDRYLEKLKETYDFRMNEEVYNRLYTLVDSSIYRNEWDPYQNTSGYDDVLFSITGHKTTLGRMIRQLDSLQRKRVPLPVENYVDGVFNRFVEEYMLDIEKESLTEKYPEYRYILQEYHDGILLFELMDRKVWTKAVEDSTGLREFFEQHREDYMWDERMKGLIVSADSTVEIGDVLKKSGRIARGRWDAEKLNKKYCSNDTVDCITLEEFVVEEGKNANVDALNRRLGVGEVYHENGRSNFVITMEKLPPQPKELDETRGLVTSDYQDYLEKEWIRELRQKYEINVNRELLTKVKTD